MDQERSTRILVECPEKIPSVRVGVLASLEGLSRENIAQVRFKETKRIGKGDIAWCDVLICVRGCEPPSVRVVKAAKAMGRYVVYFLDDDLLSVPDNLACTPYFRNPAIIRGIKDCLACCDVLWGVTPALVGRYAPLCVAAVCCPPPMQPVLAKGPAASSPVSFLYAGSVDHEGLLTRYISPAVRRLCAEAGDEVRFLFIGADPQLSGVAQVEYTPYINDYDVYTKKVVGAFHYGIAIVEDAEFYHCKYYNKYVEYTRIGAAGIYTDSLPYTYVVTGHENGFLCENTPEAWYRALRQAFDLSMVQRENMVLQAEGHLSRTHSPRQAQETLLAAIGQLAIYRASSIDSNAVPLGNGMVAFYLWRFIQSWQQRGVRTIPVYAGKLVGKLFEKIRGSKMEGKL